MRDPLQQKIIQLVFLILLISGSSAQAFEVTENRDSIIINHPTRSVILKIPPAMQGSDSYRITVLPRLVYGGGGPGSGKPLSTQEVSALVHRANKQFNEGDLDGAMENLLAAYDGAPQNTRVCNMIGSIYYKMGQFDAAREFWQRSLNTNPKQPQVESYLHKLPAGSGPVFSTPGAP